MTRTQSLEHLEPNLSYHYPHSCQLSNLSCSLHDLPIAFSYIDLWSRQRLLHVFPLLNYLLGRIIVLATYQTLRDQNEKSPAQSTACISGKVSVSNFLLTKTGRHNHVFSNMAHFGGDASMKGNRSRDLGLMALGNHIVGSCN